MPLSSLPNELLDECFSYLSLQDILSLRPLSFRLGGVATRRIREVSVYLTPQSFMNFHHLVHHSQISTSIRDVKVNHVRGEPLDRFRSDGWRSFIGSMSTSTPNTGPARGPSTRLAGRPRKHK